MELLTRILLLLFSVLVSAAAEEVKKHLKLSEGGSISLPEPVMEKGYLLFEGQIIALVNERKLRIYNKIYKERNNILWNNNTGLFTITGLKRNDSGIYYIRSNGGQETSYKLTVYESVPTPAVITVNVSAESCTLLCSVDRAEETTLLWSRDDLMVNQSSSHLSLTLTVHKKDVSSSYRCVAANPAEEKTLLVDVRANCSELYSADEESGGRLFVIGVIIPIVFVAAVLLVACIIKQKSFDKPKSIAEEQDDRDSDVQYTEVHVTGHSQQGGCGTDSSGPDSNLRTVYDKLEAHRMIPSDGADHVYDQAVFSAQT